MFVPQTWGRLRLAKVRQWMAEYDSGYLYIEYIAQTEVGNMLVIGFGVEKYSDICAVMNLHTVVTGLA